MDKDIILIAALVVVTLVLLYYAWYQEPPFASVFGEKTENLTKSGMVNKLLVNNVPMGVLSSNEQYLANEGQVALANSRGVNQGNVILDNNISNTLQNAYYNSVN